MALVQYSLDLLLVPLSLFLLASYHVFLWHNFKRKASLTTMEVNSLRRKLWIQAILQENEKKGVLAIQSLRNKLMATILAAAISLLLTSALAALMNNAYMASRPFHSSLSSSQSEPIVALKYALTMLFLLTSFFFSSLAIGYLNEANFLINVSSEFSSEFVHSMVERGCMLATVGSRILCLALALLLWMFGPVLVALSSVVLVLVLYELDFTNNGIRDD